jgi:hypothetical protein
MLAEMLVSAALPLSGAPTAPLAEASSPAASSGPRLSRAALMSE